MTSYRALVLRIALLSTFLMLGRVGPAQEAAPTDPDDLKQQLPRTQPVEPAAASATFELHDAFRLEQVAHEPLVTDPVDACYDADGRLFVVEMRGYPYPEDVPAGRVRLLVDEDRDGRFDRGTTFLDGLSWPTSVVPFDGGVFVAVPPNILYAKDTDGDGVADEQEVAFSGFGTQNVQALVNGLKWGPDGWIYGVSGGNGGTIRNHLRPGAEPVELRRYDFRFRPDGSAFEPASGGGQFGHSFDDWGHRFTSNNSNHIRQIVLPADAVDRNPHFAPSSVIADIPAEGPAGPVFRISPPEPWRIVRTRRRAADPEFVQRLPQTELVAVGFFTSATGVTIYRGSAFPEEFRNNAFIGDVGGNLVHRKTMRKDGAIYEARRSDEDVEFLASRDNWFRPVNFANTPSGTLLVLDMYRETIEHPLSIPDDIKAHLDLTSGHDRGRIYELLPKGGFQRRRSPALSHAPTMDLVAHLNDPDGWWRETAQRLLIERRDPEAIPTLHQLLSDPNTSPEGRVQTLWTLEVLGDLSVDERLQALDAKEPGVRENAVRLAAIDDPTSRLAARLAKAAEDADPFVRFQAALALGTRAHPGAVDALAAIAFRGDTDSWTRSAVLCSASGHAVALLQRLADLSPEMRRSSLNWVEDLSMLAAAEGNLDGIRALVQEQAANVDDAEFVFRLLAGLGEGLGRSSSSLDEALDPELRRGLDVWFDRAGDVARSDGSTESRLLAIRLLAQGSSRTGLDALPDLLDARQPAAVQLAALQGLARWDEPEIGAAIVAHWQALSPSLRGEAAELLLARPERVLALLDAIAQKAVPSAELDPARKAQLLGHSTPSIRERAEALLGTASRTDRSPVIARFQPSLNAAGAPARGREVFASACATCHKAEGVGIEVGPDLATVTNRTLDDLLIHILDPNREVQPAYMTYTVATEDGRVLSGMIAAESSGSITLKRAQGATDVVPRDQIEALVSTGLSLMPENLETLLDTAQMADLLAYLKSLGTQDPKP